MIDQIIIAGFGGLVITLGVFTACMISTQIEDVTGRAMNLLKKFLVWLDTKDEDSNIGIEVFLLGFWFYMFWELLTVIYMRP